MNPRNAITLDQNTGMRVPNPELPTQAPEVSKDSRALSSEANHFIMQRTFANEKGVVTLPAENPDIVAERNSDSKSQEEFMQFSPEEKPF